MKLYRGQIVDTSEDLNGEVWTIANPLCGLSEKKVLLFGFSFLSVLSFANL